MKCCVTWVVFILTKVHPYWVQFNFRYRKVKSWKICKEKLYSCYECGKLFKQNEGLSRHKRTAHGNSKWNMINVMYHLPEKTTTTSAILKKHEPLVQTGGGSGDNSQEPCNFKALNGTMKTRIIKAESISKFDPMNFLIGKYDEVKNAIKQESKERGGIKWYLAMKIKLSRRKGETSEQHVRGKCQRALKFEDIDEGFSESIKKMSNSLIEYQWQGSNWTVDKVVDLTMHMARYRPLKGSSYIPLPIRLRSKYTIINVNNKDNTCFMWSIMAALYPTN